MGHLVSDSAGSTQRCIATFECAAFTLGLSTPDSGVLAGLDGPFQAGFRDLASTADGLGLFCLEKRGSLVPVGEEEFGVLTPARSDFTPAHQDEAPFR